MSRTILDVPFMQGKFAVISPPFCHYITFLSWAKPIRGTFTRVPMPGIIKNAIKSVRYDSEKGSWYNRMKLVNKGLPKIKNNSIYSITAFSHCSWVMLFDTLEEELRNKNFIIELNVSCPNVSLNVSDEIIKKFAKKFDVILKLSSNSISETMLQYEIGRKCGVTNFHIGNTVKTIRGGLSGREIQKVSLPVIEMIKKDESNVAIIGGGGIYSAEDVKKYRDVGTDIYSLSTVFITNPWNIFEIKKEIYR